MQYLDDSLKKQRILITGGAGFIGSNLAMYFQKYHPKAEVVIFDCFRNSENFENGNPKSLGHFKNLLDFKGEIITGNLNNPEDFARIKARKFDYIFHQAAISDTTATNQEAILKTNVNAFKDLIEVCHKHNTTLIYASSAGVYGNTPAPNHIGSGEIPQNAYGFSKLAMDNLVRKYLATASNKISLVGLRYFNVYGENEFYKHKTASMILQLGLSALREKKVQLFKMGEQKRDFVYIQDVIQANIKAMRAKKSGIYNVGSGVARSYNDIIDCLKQELGDFEVQYIDNPYTFFQNHTQANLILTQKFLNYQPRFSLEIGIKNYLTQIKQIAAKGDI